MYKSLIAKNLDIEDEGLLFMILELYTTKLITKIKMITKNMAYGFVLVLYLFF